MVSLFLSKGERAPVSLPAGPNSSIMSRHNRPRILLCTPSNAAVDEILLRIIREKVLDRNGQPHDVNVVRLGESDDPCVADLTLEAKVQTRLQTSNIMQQYLTTKKQIKSLQSRLSKFQSHPSKRGANVDALKAGGREEDDHDDYPAFLSIEEIVNDIKVKISRLNKACTGKERELEAVRARLREEVMHDSDIVAGTCSGAGKAGFVDLLLKGKLSFEVCIIDEASQCSEPSTLVPLRYGCSNLILVGDPRQLPP